MKKHLHGIAVIAIILLSYVLPSCSDLGPQTEPEKSINGPGPSHSTRDDDNLGPYAPPGVFGIFEPYGLADNVGYIQDYGPNGYGFISIHLYAFGCCDPQYIETAASEGYWYRMARLDRSEITSNDWSAVRTRVHFCSDAGANVFYVDDAFSTGDMTKAQIDSVANIVHSKNAILATGEYDENRMRNDGSSWHANVDIIMPYNYNYTESQLDSFLSFVDQTYPSKIIIPFLGYEVEGSQVPQLGSYINVARQYNSVVYYYTEGIASASELAWYLQTYYGM